MNNNVVNWFDLPTKDFDRAVTFYSVILGTPIEVSDHMGKKLGFFPMPLDQKGPGLPAQAGAGGDIVPPGAGHEPSADGVRIFLNCEGKLDAVLGRVEKAGGQIMAPKFSIGTPGFIALIKDTEGNVIGLHSSK